MAKATSELVGPLKASTLSFTSKLRDAARACEELVWLSVTMNSKGRLSTPPALLISSVAIFKPATQLVPKKVQGPVSSVTKPILIGLPDCACAPPVHNAAALRAMAAASG